MCDGHYKEVLKKEIEGQGSISKGEREFGGRKGQR